MTKEDEKAEKARKKAEELTILASRRGFFFQTAEIYGGRAGFFTYGHLGKALKNRFEQLWKKHFIRENCYEIQSNNILPADVFKASGHLEMFNDPLTECKSCHFRFRADMFLEDKGLWQEGLSIEEMSGIISANNLKCPRCNGQLSPVKWFNMMFPVPLGFDDEKAYLSPETAQAAYITFSREFEATRKKLPLGLAIIDKAYRNEISPRQHFFRLREFTQAELQFFFDPEDIDKQEKIEGWKEISKYKLLLFPYKEKKLLKISCEEARKKLELPALYVSALAIAQRFYLELLGIPPEKFRFRELSEKERAFYNRIHWDIELQLDTLGGFKEVAGIHYRGNYDLSRHEKQSKLDLHVFYNEKKILPHVIETSFGIDRNIWALLDIFYAKEKVGKEERIVLRLPNCVAPIQVAVFPLVNREKMPSIAKKIYNDLKKEFLCFYDDSGSIGRRYRRADEIGIPFCITVDSQTQKDSTVTIRKRDSMIQKRIKIDKLQEELGKELK